MKSKRALFNFCILILSILNSTACIALTDEDELSKPIHYALVPSVGYQLAISELSGSSALSQGFAGGLGFRFERDQLFFTPEFRLIGLVGLDKSPATLLNYGFIAGGRIKPLTSDVFFGIGIANILGYKVDSATLVKVGAIFDLGMSDFQIVLDGFYGNFTQPTPLKLINYSFTGLEISLQLPVNL